MEGSGLRIDGEPHFLPVARDLPRTAAVPADAAKMPWVRLSPNGDAPPPEWACYCSLQVVARGLAASYANSVECGESQTYDKFRLHDTYLWQSEPPRGANQVGFRNRFSQATKLDERKQVCCVNVAQLKTKVSGQQSDEISVSRQPWRHAKPLDFSAEFCRKKLVGTPILQQQEHRRVDVVRRLRVRRDMITFVGVNVIFRDAPVVRPPRAPAFAC